VTKVVKSIGSSPREEYMLRLLLQRPELKQGCQGLKPEYFNNIENRLIFETWLKYEKLEALKAALEPALHEYLDSLIKKEIPGNEMDARFNDCLLFLKEAYLRNLKRKQETLLSMEAETGGHSAAIARLEEQGLAIDKELAEIFARKVKTPKEVNDEK
jgi:hypothetical protein